MNMNVGKKIILVVLILSILIAMVIIPTACTGEKKAIIILPGIMGSNLIDGETGKPLWAPFKGVKLQDLSISDITKILSNEAVLELLDFDGENGAYAWIDKMSIKPDGTSNYPNIVTQYIDENGMPKYQDASTYGTLECYEDIYKYLQDKCGEEYDVRIFEYDWRLDNMSAAIKLENFIKDNGYTSVVFVAHSMGGVLASTFLARSEFNRTVVDKLISLGTPYLGSHKAIRVPEDPMSLVDLGSGLNTIKSMIESLNGKGSFDIFFNKLMEFVRNVPTIYQLIPYVGMFDAYQQDGELKDLGVVVVDGKPIKSYDEFIEFLNSREFTAGNDYVDQMIKWQDEQYVTVNGQKVHASSLVDTRYFVGTEVETELAINYVDGKMVGATMLNAGDGTVCSYSASCGLPLDSKNVYVFKNLEHMEYISSAACLEKISEIIME